MSLPSSINYSEELPSLPSDAVSREIVLRPTNGATFGPNSTLQFDFLNSGFCDPESIHIRYTYTAVNAAAGSLVGLPALACFSQCRTFLGSVQAENISAYNQTTTALSNLMMGVQEKYGSQQAYGYSAGAGIAMTIENLDGRVVGINETGTVSSHLPCMLSNADKMIPLFLAPQVRVELQMDSVAGMSRADAPLTNFTLSNVELVYREVQMGASVEQMIRSQGDVVIRSSSFVNTSTILPVGAVGNINLTYNQRLASIKSAFLLMSNGAANSNGFADSFDVTNGAGQYQIGIASKLYPQTPLSTTNNRAGILMALKGASGSLAPSNAQSINSVEFNYAEAAATTLFEPSKFIVGVNTEVIPENEFILSGVSSQNSAISGIIQCNTATTVQHQVNLLLHFDCLIEINADGFASVKM